MAKKRYKCERCGKHNRREHDSVCDDCARAMAGLAMMERKPGWEALVAEARRRDARSPNGVTWKLMLWLGFPASAFLVFTRNSAVEYLRDIIPAPANGTIPDWAMFFPVMLVVYLALAATVRLYCALFDP